MNLAIAHTVSSIEHMGSGITYCVTGLAAAQAICGAAPEVFSLGQNPSYNAAPYMDHRFSNDLSGVPALRKLGKSNAMKLALRDAQPEIIHTHGLWMFPNLYRVKGAAFIIAPHGMLTPVALGFSSNKKRLFRTLFQDRALCLLIKNLAVGTVTSIVHSPLFVFQGHTSP